MTLEELSIHVMDPDLGADLSDGAEVEACGGAPQREKSGDGAFSSASTSSDSSLPSSSSNLPPVFPVCVEEDKDLLSGCSKSFTGLKLFTRR